MRKPERGSLLVGAFVVSTALAISMIGLVTFSRTATRQANSLISRTQLRRMAQETFTRNLVAVRNNIDSSKFDTSPIRFPWGEAQSFLHKVPVGLPNFESPYYLVVVATITKQSVPDPHHIRLEILIDLSQPAPASTPPSMRRKVPLIKVVEDQLRTFLSEDDPRWEEVKQQVLSALKNQLGTDLESVEVEVETNQYRDPLSGTGPNISNGSSQEAFYMNPIMVEKPTTHLRVRLWKESYY